MQKKHVSEFWDKKIKSLKDNRNELKMKLLIENDV